MAAMRWRAWLGSASRTLASFKLVTKIISTHAPSVFYASDDQCREAIQKSSLAARPCQIGPPQVCLVARYSAGRDRAHDVPTQQELQECEMNRNNVVDDRNVSQLMLLEQTRQPATDPPVPNAVAERPGDFSCYLSVGRIAELGLPVEVEHRHASSRPQYARHFRKGSVSIGHVHQHA